MKTFIKFQCKFCHVIFEREKRQTHGSPVQYCSQTCKNDFSRRKVKKDCSQCGKNIEVSPREISDSKSGNNFCSHSCSATWNNTHKTFGTRKSKLEDWLEITLKNKFPDLEFHFNRKDAINSELDIYIPSLKLAFELNGIFHYEPIYGEDKLAAIQNNDKRKFQACFEKQIELCIIDTNSMKRFKEDKAMKYFEIINDIISEKISQTC